MSEMREWWANVYADERGEVFAGAPAVSRHVSQMLNGEHGGILNGAAFRIHVRLKPEGAPRRYAGEANRKAWEADAHGCRRVMRKHKITATGVVP